MLRRVSSFCSDGTIRVTAKPSKYLLDANLYRYVQFSPIIASEGYWKREIYDYDVETTITLLFVIFEFR